MKELLARSIAHANMKKRRLPLDQPGADTDNAKKNNRLSSELNNKSPNKREITEKKSGGRPTKRAKELPAAVDFLGISARKAKRARAQKASRAGIQQANKNRRSHTGSSMPLSKVIRLKYVKGFTQAVRTPCRVEDLM